MGYTPRQLAAFVELANKRKTRDAAVTLSLHALAAQGKPSAINKKIKELSKL